MKLASLRGEFGRYVGRQKAVTLPGVEGANKISEAMRRFRTDDLWEVGGYHVENCWDLEAGFLRWFISH